MRTTLYVKFAADAVTSFRSPEPAGELIGGGPRAFQKYEAGDLLPSRATGSAPALLDRDPSGLSVLQERSNAG